jgi:comEA protein
MTSVLRNPRALACMASLVLATALAVSPALAVERGSLEGVVNINTASAEQLQMLPGVGEVRARAILSERKERGGFKSVEDLRAVKGVGDSLLERMKPHVTLTGKTTAQQM